MIYKRKQFWHMDVTVNGIRYREAPDTTGRKQATVLERDRIAQIEQGKAISVAGRDFAKKPFIEAAQMHLEDRKGRVAPRTSQFESERLKPLCGYFGEKALLRIRADDIAAYQKMRLNSGLSGKTINMEVGVLRLMLKRSRQWTG
ncbi:MAG: hypothetical protein M3Y27_18145 [Acidobacteriota bacterium]|nr:hypothetical protein [Acidobacteriota bacterium]